jgi:O-antigen ligase
MGASLLAVALCLNALAIVASRPAVVPALAVGAVGIAAMLLRPAWVFPALVGLTWTSLGTAVLGGLPSPIEVGALAFLGVAAVRAFQRTALTREVLLVCALFGLPVVIAALTSRNAAALEILPTYGKNLVFLLLVALCVVSVRDVQRVAMALTITGAILGAGAIFSVLVGPTALFPLQNLDDATEAPRAVGPFGEANFFALSLAVLVPFALFQVARGGRVALFGALTTIILTGGVLAAGSRGGLLTILVVLIGYAWWSGNRRLRWSALGVICSVALLVPIFAGQAASSRGRTIEGRATENLIAAQMWADFPVTGVGPGQYPDLYRDYARGMGNDPRVLRHPHNLILELAAEQGTIGLFSWLCAALVVALAVIRARLWTSLLGKAVLMSIGAYFFCTLFLHGSQMRLLYMLVGLTLAMSAAVVASGRARTSEPAVP